VRYFHVVFTLPASVGEIAIQNKAAVYFNPRHLPADRALPSEGKGRMFESSRARQSNQ
jgi:hypothetical protein